MYFDVLIAGLRHPTLKATQEAFKIMFCTNAQIAKQLRLTRNPCHNNATALSPLILWTPQIFVSPLPLPLSLSANATQLALVTLDNILTYDKSIYIIII